MAIDAEKLLAWHVPDVEHRFEARDTMLYALGCGAGADPLDEGDLKFVFEEELVALPTMAVVLGYPGFWIRDPSTGVDWKRLLHGEQGLTLHKPLPSAGLVIGRTRITDLIDKGAGKGALLYSARDIFDHATGDLLATTTSTTFLRGDGGCGGRPAGAAPPRDSGSRPRPVSGPADRRQRRADLSSVGRLQSAARQPACRGGGRLSPPDPARTVHLRRRRPRSLARGVRE